MEQPFRRIVGHQFGAKLAQDGGVKAGVGKLQAQRVLPVDPAADCVGKLVLDSREAVVDGVLDGGRQANRRSTAHQADGKHQLLGREQHKRTTGQRTDDHRRATDLAVGGSSPSRRATKPQVSWYVFASPRSS